MAQALHSLAGRSPLRITPDWKITEMNANEYVHYGCGTTAPQGWRNFDGSLTVRFERLPLIGRLWSKNTWRFPDNVEYGDIVHGLPVASGSCRGVYCSHILEHLALEDCKTALRQTKRILRPGGIFRLVLPDLDYSIKLYLANSASDAAHEFLRETLLGLERRPRRIRDFIFAWLGNERHLWMWDYRSIELELMHAGFVDIRRASCGDSTDPKFQEVEDQLRWDNCVGVDCRSPG